MDIEIRLGSMEEANPCFETGDQSEFQGDWNRVHPRCERGAQASPIYERSAKGKGCTHVKRGVSLYPCTPVRLEV